MFISLRFGIFISIITELVLSIAGYTLSGNQINDLEWQNKSFVNELTNWNYSFSNNLGPTSQCENQTILGGFNVISPNDKLRRQYFDLPPHNVAIIRVQIWRIDSLDITDGMIVQVDNTTYYFYDQIFTRNPQQICGNPSFADGGPLDILIIKAHNYSNITLTVINKCDQDSLDESIGVRDVNLIFLYNKSGLVDGAYFSGAAAPLNTNALGLSCPKGYFNDSMNCKICDSSCKFCYNETSSDCYVCNEGYYFSNGTCKACYPGCRTCMNSSENSCTSCSENRYLHYDSTCKDFCYRNSTEPALICQYPQSKYIYPDGNISDWCPQNYIYSDKNYNYCNITCSPTKFLYTNGSCLGSCNYPFKPAFFDAYQSCDLLCSENEFLYQNGSCIRNCDSPFKIVSDNSYQNFCNFSCSLGEYYMENGICSKTCSSPLKARSTDGFQFCDFPCSKSQFLYSDNNCIDQCPRGFTVTFSNLGAYCTYDCISGEYMYSNKSCLKNCSGYFYLQKVYDQHYCEFPCPSTQFLDSNYSCINNCSSPNIIIDYLVGKFCQYSQDNGMKALASLVGNTASATAGATAGMVVAGLDPTTAVAFITILQNFYYLLFFNVNYPDNVKTLLGSFGIVKLNFLPNPLESFTDKIPDLSSPSNFYYNGYTGLFLNSAGLSLSILFLFGIIYPISTFIGHVLRINFFIKRIFRFIYRNIRVKTFIRLVLIFYMELMMTSLLQLISEIPNDPLVRFSIFCAYIVFIIMLLLPYLMLYLIKRRGVNFNFLKRIDPFIEDYDINHKTKRIFGFFVLKKKEIHSIAIVIFYYTPILQTIIPFLCNFAMIFLYVKHRPHNRMILNVFDTLYEVGYLALHSSVLSLAYIDTSHNEYPRLREFIGWMMIVAIIWVFLSGILQIWIENISTIRLIYHNWKEKKLKPISKKIKKGKLKKAKIKRFRVKKIEAKPVVS